ncbi:Maf family protein, partial [Bacillus cereus group sp. BC334]
MTVWRERQPLILASQSAVRKSLLVNAGIAVETVPADIDERAIQQTSGLTEPGRIAGL